LDWAGGTPVHISSGSAALAYALAMKYIRLHWPDKKNEKVSWKDYMQPRPDRPRAEAPEEEELLQSHNMTNACLGTMLVWFGWFGFNAGSELHANIRAASTFVASNVAACSGAVAYVLLEELSGIRWSGLGFCTGAFAGLVAITPAAGYVPAWAGLVIGSTASAICFAPTYFSKLRAIREYLEEPIDIFIIHGLGGLWGMLMTGLFAE
jgi:ammonium transporter, Amt family